MEFDCEFTECRCGEKFKVIVETCGIVNCPTCGTNIKVGSCG